MKPFGIAIGLALASATTAAQAQTVISRQITTEPVETVITQGPDGTAVIRRPLGPAPVSSAPATYYDSFVRPAPVVSAPASTYYEPYARPAAPIYGASRDVVETVETVKQPAPATTVRREVVRPRTTTTTRRVQRARAPAARTRSSQTVRTAERVTTRVAPAPAPREVVLTPQQRQIVYRTIVRERAAPPVVTREVLVPSEPLAAYGSVRSVSTAPAVESVSYVGRVLPRSVMFYDVPQSVALNVPATRGFRYAYVDDRVLLVDPVTRMVVEELDE
jgi:Protein of unknown function (DUF1236)